MITTTNTSVTVEANNNATLPDWGTVFGVAVNDIVDGDITTNTSKVTYSVSPSYTANNVPGTYTITVSATDAATNNSTTTLTYIVQGTTIPTLTIANTTVYAAKGDTQTEAELITLVGATATDVTGTPTVNINMTPIDFNTVGTYVATVSAKDATNNTATGTITVQVLVTNTAPINNETVVANNFTIKLADVATADFITLANAKGYDVTSPANPVEIPVVMTTQKPTTIGNHTIHFETTNGGYADIVATIIDTNAYLEVNADNVVVDLKTVQTEIIHRTLESYILENANATATLHTSVESISLSPDVLVADTKELENSIQVGVYDVEISTNYVIGEGRSSYSFEKYINDTTQPISSELYSSKTITFEIVDGNDEQDKTLPTTGQNNLEIMYIGLLILCGSIVVFIFLTRKPKNI